MSLELQNIAKIHEVGPDGWLYIQLGSEEGGDAIGLKDEYIIRNTDSKLPFHKGQKVYVWQPNSYTGAVFSEDRKVLYVNPLELQSIDNELFDLLDRL